MALQDYYPLDAETQEIRLLSLEPGCFSDDIYIQLHRYSLSTTPRLSYEALSYVWGSSKNFVPIQIRTQNRQTQQMLVTQNLFAALKRLRYEQSTRDLWVDAICINQNNVIGRGQQVAMMGNIYCSATKVIAWLGSEDDDSTHALQFLDKLSSEITVLVMNRRECNAIYRLLMRPWFERVWIIQEISLGRNNAI
ncbi:heterokaryon incompatibility protein-domain-containing protein, partial [Bisporella sp. PMI_857]